VVLFLVCLGVFTVRSLYCLSASLSLSLSLSLRAFACFFYLCCAVSPSGSFSIALPDVLLLGTVIHECLEWSMFVLSLLLPYLLCSTAMTLSVDMEALTAFGSGDNDH
jgi:hypothetical protein